MYKIGTATHNLGLSFKENDEWFIYWDENPTCVL